MHRIILITMLIFASCGGKEIGITLKILNADKLYNSKEYTEAIKLYSEIIAATDEDDWRKYFGYYKRACSNYYLKNYNKTLSDISKAIQIKKGSYKYNDIIGSSLRLKGGVFSRTNRKVKAVEFYKEGLNYIQEPTLLSDLGYCLTKINKTEEAILYLKKSIELDPESAYSRSNIGLAYLKNGNLKESILNLNLSEKLNSENPFVCKHKALYYLKIKERDKACEYLNKSMDLKYTEVADDTENNEVKNLIKENCK